MTRGRLLLVAAWAVAAGVVALTDTVAAGLLTAVLLAAVATVGLGAAELVVRRRRTLGTLDLQLSLAVALGVGLIVLTALVFALVMFLSAHDALLVCLVTAVMGVVAVLAARRITMSVIGDIWIVRDALMAMGGRRTFEPVRIGGQDEVAQLAEATNAMAHRLAAEEAARRGLVAAVSHDLRTPMTSLRLLADALGDDILEPDERRTYVERLRTHVGALNALVEDLFELSRLEAGDVDWSLQRVPLAPLVEETVDAMRAVADPKQIGVRTAIPEDLPFARANPEKLQRVLFNLLQNAIQHTAARGTVDVRAEPVGAWLEVEVADTGAGIATGDRPHVFEPFYRGGDRSARGGGGAGLGLAISRGIVEAHGGRLWLGEVERGTRVRFSLPLAA